MALSANAWPSFQYDHGFGNQRVPQERIFRKPTVQLALYGVRLSSEIASRDALKSLPSRQEKGVSVLGGAKESWVGIGRGLVSTAHDNVVTDRLSLSNDDNVRFLLRTVQVSSSVVAPWRLPPPILCMRLFYLEPFEVEQDW